ncbi:hypothetical protein [uncultured Acetobacteroides sp.]|uniref:hypothetical protein n=1 Tax=uncultured Acetobacteroides sp. TaxID=1760811 RepID=UPI0029F555EB|nr:hypothetical protein [uncultured Acetobacteroides sp.]
MNRTLTLTIFFSLFVRIGLAQTLDVELASQPVKFVNPKIYVDNVVDNRDFTSWIGTTKVAKNRQRHLNLSGGVASAIKSHTDYILPPSPEKKPVTMHIMVLSAKEQPTSNGSEKATVTAVTSFTAQSKAGGEVEIYRTSSTVSESGRDATTLYEKLIRRAIEECLEQLNSKDVDKLTADAAAIQQLRRTKSEVKVLPDSISLDRLVNIGSSKSEEVANPESASAPMPMGKKAEPEERYYRVDEMSTVSILTGINGIGCTATYYINSLYSDNRIYIPLTVSAEYMDNITTSEASRYQEPSLYYAKIGAELFYPLNKYFWLNAGVQIPLGTEKLADLDGNDSETLLAGICLTQSIRVMSSQYEGVTFAVGAFEQILSSKIQPFNVGLRIEIGIKF